jgi:dipeptidyl-peptidase-4
LNDGKHFAAISGGVSIGIYSYESGERIGSLFDARKHLNVGFIRSFEMDHDGGMILLTTDKEKIYRRSFRAHFLVYDTERDSIVPLSNSGKQRLAKFSPDGKWIAFVRNNNIYLADPFNGIEKQITSDGLHNEVINGATDWVYEEEFAFDRGFYWSPDSKKIAFYRFDEKRVKEFNMTMYGSLYPENYTFKYPKAGEKNTIVTIHVYDLESGEIRQLDTGTETDQYIPRIKWTEDPDILCIMRLNRLQNQLEILHADAGSCVSEIVYRETNRWFISEATDHTISYLPDRKHFILLSEQNGYFHFYLYDFRKKRIEPITSGDFDVGEFLAYDAKEERLYYTSYEVSSIEKHVYSIRINGKEKKKISQEAGFNKAIFSDDFNYYFLFHSAFDSPEKVSLHARTGKLVRAYTANARVKKSMQEYGFTQTEFFTIHTASGQDLNAYMIRPADFDATKVYPLFIYVYGGPESQKVAQKWENRRAWFQLLVQQGYIVACIDNRGTNGRGEAFRKSTYMQLGKLETVDQLEAVAYLGSLDYIDASRIGIFGWSYGGFMTSLCMTKGGGLYKMGIAVAPVTNWRYYDTIYTERFMRTPDENTEGYEENSPLNFADQLQGKLLLIHGTGDDNVHFQNSIEFTEALVQADKQFEMQFYMNRDHGIRGGNTTYHLYTRMTDFILKNL